ncbi:MAG: hypothetical protein HC896_07240 [Bacteroidales bacterium]|nr:hypothetical protein [Bacteroidales bacterium]
MAYWLAKLNELVDSAISYNNGNGLHIKSYKTSINEQPGFYQEYIPENYNSEPSGLLVFMPTLYAYNLPFLTGYIVGHQPMINEFSYYANKHNVIILMAI